MTRPELPASFRAAPIAHRALHDAHAGRAENGPAAIAAAVAAGYGIEIDLQLSADDVAMVFHDYALERMTGADGSVRDHSARALMALGLRGEDGAGIPTLADALAAVRGRVPLLLELKDQARAGGPGVGPLEHATAHALRDYSGPVAVMSFNPASVATMAHAAPAIPRGLTSCAFNEADAPELDAATRARLAAIADFDTVGASFVSHRAADLEHPRIAELKRRRVPVLSWTIRSPREEEAARRIADNITFEGYLPALAR